MNFSTTALISYAIAGGGALIFGLLLWWGYTLVRSHKSDVAYDEQLEALINGESDEDELMAKDRGSNIKEKWTIYWQNLGKASGLQRYEDRNNSAPKDVLFLSVIILILASALARNPIVGLAAAGAIVYVMSLFLRMKYNQQQALIQDQIPGFLFALKANIQANETPVRAILKIVDNMPEPLRSDLTVVKQKILANSSFQESLQALLEKTTSGELRFLATCLIQAAGTGANIEPQINTIQKVLEQRKKAADELAKAVRATLPAIYISSVAIPGSFAATYMMDPNARDFWFTNLLSWVALGGIVFLYGIGMWMTRRMIENIRNL